MAEFTKEIEKVQPEKRKENGKPGNSFKEGMTVVSDIKSNYVRTGELLMDFSTLPTSVETTKHGEAELKCIG